MEWDESPNIYLNFLANANHIHRRTIWNVISHRIKCAWTMFRGKDMCLHDIILDIETWFKFYEKMTEFNNKIKEKENAT